jgi:hypothetical protein
MGRPRKNDVKRDASGKSRGYDGIHPETIAVRERELKKDGIILHQMRYNGVSDVATSTATDAKAGFTLGRLLLFHEQGDVQRGINRKQFEAGDYWAGLCRRHAAIMGYSLGVKSPTLGQIGGLSTTEPLEETVIYVRQQWSNAYNRLRDLIPDYSDRPLKLSFGVCVENWPIGVLTANDYGLLRIALNTIGQALDLGRKNC